MEYTCELANVNKYMYSRDGMKLSLCNTCKTRDCTNPIEFIQYSIYGVLVECRVYQRGGTPYFVTLCQGYSNKDDESAIDDNEDNK